MAPADGVDDAHYDDIKQILIGAALAAEVEQDAAPRIVACTIRELEDRAL